MKITKETALAEILKLEGAEGVLAKYNVPCLGCAMAVLEIDKLKIGDVCQMYGIDCEKLLKELNTELSRSESEGEDEGKLRRR